MFDCGGKDCHGRHALPEPWDATVRRRGYGDPCIDQQPTEWKPDRKEDYGDNYGGPLLDW